MDLFSHAVLPYLLGDFFKRNKQEITAFVLGGIAPDSDIFIMWINYIYPTFLLIIHRGITHSLFFGFFTALIILYIASRDKIKSIVQRFIDFDPVITARTVAFAYAGVLIHLFLDYTTTLGIPLFYPFDITRWSAEVFFYTDTTLTILSLIIIAYLYRVYLHRRPLQRNTGTKLLVVFLIVFAILGTIRIAEKGSTESFFKDVKTYPTMNPFDWYALGESKDNRTLKIYEYNGLTGTSQYSETIKRLNVLSGGWELNSALAIADDLPQVEMYMWKAYTVAINASFVSGIWFLEYYDPMQRAMSRDSPEVLRMNNSIKVMVEAGKAVVL